MAAYEYTLERTAGYLSPHQRVLEIGCGTGTTALRLAPHVAQYIGTDVSDEMIAIACEKNAAEAVAHLSFEQFDVDTDHTKQTYDMILGFNVLHLLRGSDYGISTLDQMLQPGGLLITKTICYPDGWRGIALRSIIAVMPLLRMIGKAPFVRIPTISDLHAAFDSLGYEVLEQGNYPASPPRRFIVARKPD